MTAVTFAVTTVTAVVIVTTVTSTVTALSLMRGGTRGGRSPTTAWCA